MSATNFDFCEKNVDSVKFINSLTNTANYYSKSKERTMKEEYE